MNTFTNKVVVVTGGNSGIGLATAKEFSRRGAKVVISGRDEKTLAEAAASIGGETLAVRADVSRLADLDKLFARTKERFGSIDVLFVNAGIAKFAPVEQTTEAMHDEILDINFKGAFFTVQKALPLLKDGGAIVINTSVVAGKGMPTRQRLCGEQGGAAVADPDAGGGTARSKNPSQRRRPRPDLRRPSSGGMTSPPKQPSSWRTGSPSSADEAPGRIGRGRQGRDLPRLRRCLVHHRRRTQHRRRHGPTVIDESTRF